MNKEAGISCISCGGGNLALNFRWYHCYRCGMSWHDSVESESSLFARLYIPGADPTNSTNKSLSGQGGISEARR
jgi:hypothetical protein